MQRALVETLVAKKKLGLQAGGGFKQPSYNLAIEPVKMYTPAHDHLLLCHSRFVTKYENLKRAWKA